VSEVIASTTRDLEGRRIQYKLPESTIKFQAIRGTSRISEPVSNARMLIEQRQGEKFVVVH
jgi:hypothetical protein